MKQHTSDRSVIFIRTDNETKQEFMDAVNMALTDQNEAGNRAIIDWIKKIKRKYENQNKQQNNQNDQSWSHYLGKMAHRKQEEI